VLTSTDGSLAPSAQAGHFPQVSVHAVQASASLARESNRGSRDYPVNHEIVLTPSKFAELKAELEHLLTVERPLIAERIRQARALGDLSENFDYQDAKRQQGFLEGRIHNLKSMLERGHVVEYVGGSDVVGLGSAVNVWDQEFEEEIEYTIVGALETDPSKNRISNTSPIGSALLGSKIGDTVRVETPGGMQSYEVRNIREHTGN
jgi:transcription elongation factor GreA